MSDPHLSMEKAASLPRRIGTTTIGAPMSRSLERRIQRAVVGSEPVRELAYAVADKNLRASISAFGIPAYNPVGAPPGAVSHGFDAKHVAEFGELLRQDLLVRRRGRLFAEPASELAPPSRLTACQPRNS